MRRKFHKNKKALMDQDYLAKLKPEEREWLEKFNDEYYEGSFKNDGTDLHQAEEQKSECVSRKNAIDRDFYAPVRSHPKTERECHKSVHVNRPVNVTTIAEGAFGSKEDYAAACEQHPNPKSTEDALVRLVDEKRRHQKKMHFGFALAASFLLVLTVGCGQSEWFVAKACLDNSGKVVECK